jgi:hypothetical protein
MARKYAIALPYRTSFWDSAKIRIGLGLPEVQAALKRLPAPLVAKLQSVSPANPVTFTKADFDSIPDDLWRALAPHLG